jgi:hypothetical protein
MDAWLANEDAMFGFLPHSATGMGAMMVWNARDLRAVFIERLKKQRRKCG